VGPSGVVDAHAAVARLREEPLRAAVAEVFASPAAEVAFRPLRAPALRGVTAEGHTDLADALEELARVTASGVPARPVAEAAEVLLDRLTALEPRRMAAAVGGWALAWGVGEVACGGDGERTLRAFDAWDGAAGLGARLRGLGFGDADAWRAVELTRALLAIPRGALRAAAASEGSPDDWFEHEPVRAAAGWNEWQGQRYLTREAWAELLDALAVRDGHPTQVEAARARADARELKRRLARADYRLAHRPGPAPDA
jgi:hypothetical protein